MISINVYRVRIGSFDNSRMKTPAIKSKNHKLHSRRNITIIVSILLWLMLLYTLTFPSLTIANVVLSVSSGDMCRSTIMNYKYLYKNWNKLMHSMSRDLRNSVKLGHWNGGPSYFGRQGREVEKLETIKEILLLHKLDVLGISEANIEKSMEETSLHIDGYELVRSNGKIARLCM